MAWLMEILRICLEEQHHEGFNISAIPKYDGWQHELVSVVYLFFGFVKSLGGSVTRAGKSAIKSEIIANQHPSDLFPLIKVSDHMQQLAE